MIGATSKLYKYLLKNHKLRAHDIGIWEYIDNPALNPPFIKSGKYEKTYLRAKELEKEGLVKILLHDHDNRALIYLIENKRIA